MSDRPKPDLVRIQRAMLAEVLAIAIAAPENMAQNGTCYIPRWRIHNLRTYFAELGIDWRAVLRKSRAEDLARRQARMAEHQAKIAAKVSQP